MSIKMRINNDPAAECCECGESGKDVLNMFDLRIGNSIHTICDKCNSVLFMRVLKADCMKNSRVKDAKDIEIIQKRAKKDYAAKVRKEYG